MKILYIHGYMGNPDGTKPRALRAGFPKAVVMAPSHDSHPDHVFALLDPIAAEMDPSEDVIVGNSLGGFWANYLSLRYELPALLINPAVMPSSQLKNLDCEFAGEYSRHEQQIDCARTAPRIVLLAKDDFVLPYHIAIHFFESRCEVILREKGGHEMNDPDSLEAIVGSLKRMMRSVWSDRLCE